MDEVTYDLLRRVQQKERSTGMLSELPDDFYAKAADLLGKMKGELGENFALEKAKEYENALKIARDVYSVREQKIIFRAMRGAKGGDGIAGVAKEESEMYGRVKDAIAECEARFEKTLVGEAPKAGGSERISETKRIKALADIPQFIGVDGVKYGPFKKDEAIVVPQRISELLLRKKVAAEA